MSHMRQTSVLISATASAKLNTLTKARGRGRDATVRALLEQYVERQAELAKAGRDRRLTHIGTALHYPYCLNEPGRGPGKVRLLRLPFRAPQTLLAAAQSHAYRIPGHASGRGHRDYASRPLGDAVTTAISLESSFLEPELAGLPPVLQHRVIDALWQLTRAATMTHTEWVDLERQIPEGIRGDRVEESVRRVTTFLETSDVDYMWHSPERAAVALALARTYLNSDNAVESSLILRGWGPDFESEVDHLLDSSPGRTGDADIVPGLVSNAEGRAASRLWVRDRADAHHRLAKWLIEAPHAERRNPVVDPPGWTLRWEPEWRSATFGYNEALPSTLHADLIAGRLLRVDHGSRSAVWPLAVSGHPRGVPGFEHVIAGMRIARPSANAIEIFESCLIGPQYDESDADVEIVDTSDPLFLWLGLDEAHQLGLINAEEHESLKRSNLAANQAGFAAIMDRPRRRWGDRLSQSEERDLHAAAVTDVDRFFELAERFDLYIGASVSISTPRWAWPVSDLRSATALYEGPVLEAFARCRMKATLRGLHQSQSWAWRSAMWWTWTKHGYGDDAEV